MRKIGWLGFILAGIPAVAMAQAPPSGMMGKTGTGMGGMGMMGTRISGTVESVGAGSITLSSSTGPVYTIAVPPSAPVMGMKAMTVADIHVGDFVGSGATKDASGKFTANEVHIIKMRGSGEGQRQMGADVTQVMTNAAITSITPTPPGETITLTYGTHNQPIYLPPGVSVTMMGPTSHADLKPGANVMVMATTNKQGGLTAGMVMVTGPGAKTP
jgi:hypothetical protein